METGLSAVDDIVLSSAEFIDAWATHERNAARLALAGWRCAAIGLTTVRYQ